VTIATPAHRPAERAARQSYGKLVMTTIKIAVVKDIL
jgi:hypothetical protein